MGRVWLVMLVLASCSKKQDAEHKGDPPAEGTSPAGRAPTDQDEATTQLERLGKAATARLAVDHMFPMGAAGPTPSTPCCEHPDHTCPKSLDWDNDKLWFALQFAIDRPTRFQYSYESNAKSVTAKAVGDLDCDGTSITYTLEIASRKDPALTITPPPPNSD